MKNEVSEQTWAVANIFLNLDEICERFSSIKSPSLPTYLRLLDVLGICRRKFVRRIVKRYYFGTQTSQKINIEPQFCPIRPKWYMMLPCLPQTFLSRRWSVTCASPSGQFATCERRPFWVVCLGSWRIVGWPGKNGCHSQTSQLGLAELFDPPLASPPSQMSGLVNRY